MEWGKILGDFSSREYSVKNFTDDLLRKVLGTDRFEVLNIRKIKNLLRVNSENKIILGLTILMRALLIIIKFKDSVSFSEKEKINNIKK